ncbi:MFS transporter [Paenibacillus sp. TAB 01]|uniref:MFS transporter n=1 Tax=Paenibacillus sp. TAB 01 TaxID=3368988 RepID=UPI0037504CBA
MIHHVMHTLSPLRNRNFRIYIGGQGISMLGNWMQGTAQAWVVWRLTGSTAALGIVAMLNTLPVLLLGPFSGVTADRLDRRRLLIYTNLLAMILAIVMGMLLQTGTVRLWHVYVLAGILGCINALDIPSQQAFLGDLSGVEQVRKGFTLNAIMEQVMRMIGPSAAGWMIGSFGEAPAFWLNGLSYIAVLASLFVVKAAQERQVSSSHPAKEFRAGLAFVRRKPRIQELILFTAMTTLFGFVNTQLFPEIADHLLHGGPETLGTMMGTFGAGSFFSALLLTPLLQRVRTRMGAVCRHSLDRLLVFYFFVFQLAAAFFAGYLFRFLRPARRAYNGQGTASGAGASQHAGTGAEPAGDDCGRRTAVVLADRRLRRSIRRFVACDPDERIAHDCLGRSAAGVSSCAACVGSAGGRSGICSRY